VVLYTYTLVVAEEVQQQPKMCQADIMEEVSLQEVAHRQTTEMVLEVVELISEWSRVPLSQVQV
jgi:hypothetical protein